MAQHGDAALFPGETDLAQFLGTIFVFPEALSMPGMNIGGRGRYSASCTIHITQYRIRCDAHLMNRLRGTTSILLDTITDATEIPAMPSPHLRVMAGIPYEFAFFTLAEPRAALALAMRQSSPERCAAGRTGLFQAIFPRGIGDITPRDAAYAAFSAQPITNGTLLHSLALYNLWLSLSHA